MHKVCSAMAHRSGGSDGLRTSFGAAVGDLGSLRIPLAAFWGLRGRSLHAVGGFNLCFSLFIGVRENPRQESIFKPTYSVVSMRLIVKPSGSLSPLTSLLERPVVLSATDLITFGGYSAVMGLLSCSYPQCPLPVCHILKNYLCFRKPLATSADPISY